VNLKEVMDGAFKYKIGDIVISRAAVRAYSLEHKISGKRSRAMFFDRPGVPIGDVVIERQLQECHGGVQKHYVVRRMSPDCKTQALMQQIEDELVLYNEVEALFVALAESAKQSSAD